MKLYAIRRPMGWKTPEDLAEAAATSARVGDNEMSSDIRWIRSYVLGESDDRVRGGHSRSKERIFRASPA